MTRGISKTASEIASALARLEFDPEELWDRRKVAEVIGIHKDTVTEHSKSRRFPERVELSREKPGRPTPLWRAEDIVDYYSEAHPAPAKVTYNMVASESTKKHPDGGRALAKKLGLEYGEGYLHPEYEVRTQDGVHTFVTLKVTFTMDVDQYAKVQVQALADRRRGLIS